MKEYFDISIPIIYEWKMMRRIAISRLQATGMNLKDIAEVLGMSYKNTWQQSTKHIDKEIDSMFNFYLSKGRYPIREGNRTIWKRCK